jgi:dipeptidyl aminopeptidase/acylaminoacyl peptidase
MLLICGLPDDHVLISHALQVWTDLKRHEVPAKCLLFPDGDDSLALKPADVTLYQQTVVAFVDHHVLGRP